MAYRTMKVGLALSGFLWAAACSSEPAPPLADTAAPKAVAEPRDDSMIGTEIQARFYGNESLRGRDIDVRVDQGVVTLDGKVDTDAGRQRAAALANEVDGVSRVDNQIEVDAAAVAGAAAERANTAAAKAEGTAAEAADNVNASWITMKIQSQYFVDSTVKPWNIDVTTSDTGIVTLAGRVDSEASKSKATEIARATEGVRRVENKLRVAPDAEQRETPKEVEPGSAPAQPAATRNADSNVVEDGWITMKIQSKYFLDGDVAGRHINVDTREGVVTLNGEVQSEAERRQALALARNTDGVRSVTDQLRIAADAAAKKDAPAKAGRSATQAADDTWVTTKIQSKYFLDDDVKGRSVDVTTRKGVVTLAGTVASDAARKTAEAIARETEGVTRVVNQLKVAPQDAAQAPAAPKASEAPRAPAPPA